MEHILFLSSFLVIYIYIKIQKNIIDYSNKILKMEYDNQKLKKKIKKIQNVIGVQKNG